MTRLNVVSALPSKTRNVILCWLLRKPGARRQLRMLTTHSWNAHEMRYTKFRDIVTLQCVENETLVKQIIFLRGNVRYIARVVWVHLANALPLSPATSTLYTFLEGGGGVPMVQGILCWQQMNKDWIYWHHCMDSTLTFNGHGVGVLFCNIMHHALSSFARYQIHFTLSTPSMILVKLHLHLTRAEETVITRLPIGHANDKFHILVPRTTDFLPALWPGFVSLMFRELSKFVYCKYRNFYENFLLKLFMCAQSYALVTRTQFLLEILTINVNSGIVHIRDYFGEFAKRKWNNPQTGNWHHAPGVYSVTSS